MDPRLVEALRQFRDEQLRQRQLPASAEPASNEIFTRFCLWLAQTEFGFGDIDPEQAHVDGSGDLGVDVFATEIDGQIVATSAEALAAASNEDCALRFLIIQARRKTSLTEMEVTHFGGALQRLIENYNSLPSSSNPNIRRQVGIYGALRDEFARQQRPFVPEVRGVLAYGGVWNADSTEGREQLRKRMQSNWETMLPGAQVSFGIWGADQMLAVLRHVASDLVRTLYGADMQPMPQGEAAGYTGTVCCQALLDMIAAECGTVPEARMFIENPRHFLGLSQRKNPGAYGLEQLLRSGHADRVIICNNGLTIVAKSAQRLADGGFMLVGPQIVNGCQTAYTLFNNRDRLEGAHVTVKIVVNTDEEQVDEVVRGANTQRNMSPFDMLARLPFVRRLAGELDQKGSHGRPIWFQRRVHEPTRGQWPGAVDELRLFTPKHALEAVGAGFLGLPHNVHQGPGSLLNLVPFEIFNPAHEPAAYGLALETVAACRRWALAHNRNWQDKYDGISPGGYGARHQLVRAVVCLLIADPDHIDLTTTASSQKYFAGLAGRILGTGGDVLVARAAEAIDATAAGGATPLSELASLASFTRLLRAKIDALKARG